MESLFANARRPRRYDDGHDDTITSVAFSAKGYLASRSSDGTMKTWDATTGRERFTTHHPGYAVNPIAFSADGRYLVASSRADFATIWDATTGREKQTVYNSNMTSIAISMYGLYLAFRSHNGTIFIWDIVSNKKKQTLEGHMAYINSVAFSTRNYLASGSSDNTVKL